MAKRPDPDLKAAAVEAVRRGMSLSEAGKIADVSKETVRRWVRDADAQRVVEMNLPPGSTIATIVTDAPSVDAPPVEAPDDADTGTLDFVRRAMRQANARARDADRVGDTKNAQRAARDAAEFAKIVTRLEKAAADDGDALRITRAEIDEARDVVRARFAALAARPLLCAACSRALSIALGTAPEIVPDAEK